MCVCVCVCVCILPTWKLLLTARCSRHTWEVRINDLVLWIFIWVLCQVPSSPYRKMSYFTSKDENSSPQHTGEKAIWYNALHKRWYIMIQDISQSWPKADKWQKDTKDKEATLNSSTLNQVLGISRKKICLSLSDIAASLMSSTFWCTMVKTSWFDKPPHCVKMGFIEGDCKHRYGCSRLVIFNNKYVPAITSSYHCG